MSFFVKTIVNGNCRAVEVDFQMTLPDFINKALRKHELRSEEIHSEHIVLEDKDGLRIDNMKMIQQWKNCNYFIVYLKADIFRTNVTIVAQNLNKFLLDSEDGRLIVTGNKTDNHLNHHNRLQLVQQLYLFLQKDYPTATSEQIVTVCKAALQLFPSIESVDVLYNKSKQNGSLFNKIRNMGRQKSRRKRSMQNNVHNHDEEEWTTEDKRDLKEFFRHCVVRTQREQIEQKLRETVAFRREIILSSFNEYMDMWAFYFAAPDLVIKDFGYHFPELKAGGLTANWSKISSIPSILERKKIEKAWLKITDKNDDLRHFLEYLVLVSSYRVSFDKAIKSLFVFHDENAHVDVMSIRATNLNHPYIIAIFAPIGNEVKFYVDVQNRIFTLDGYTFIEVIDFFIKLHNLFNYEYGKDFQRLMAFIEYAVYGIASSKRLLAHSHVQLAEKVMEETQPYPDAAKRIADLPIVLNEE